MDLQLMLTKANGTLLSILPNEVSTSGKYDWWFLRGEQIIMNNWIFVRHKN